MKDNKIKTMIEFNNKIQQGLASIYLLFKIYESNDIELINKIKELRLKYDELNRKYIGQPLGLK